MYVNVTHNRDNSEMSILSPRVEPKLLQTFKWGIDGSFRRHVLQPRNTQREDDVISSAFLLDLRYQVSKMHLTVLITALDVGCMRVVSSTVSIKQRQKSQEHVERIFFYCYSLRVSAVYHILSGLATGA